MKKILDPLALPQFPRVTNQIVYSERPSIQGLAPWVQCLWRFDARRWDGGSYQHSIPPDGCISILCKSMPQLSQSMLLIIGPWWEPQSVAIAKGELYEGIRFWPYAARSLARADLPRIIGQRGLLSVLHPVLAEQLHQPADSRAERTESRRMEFFQSVLQRWFSDACEMDDMVRTAVARIIDARGNLPIAELAETLDISPRQLQRRFLEETGMTPKQFARIRRFREAAAELLRESPRAWCQVAIDSGYADQAHLTREFTQLIGLTPKELQGAHNVIFHDGVDP